ncbi:MAG: cobalamin-binding protein [Acidobacteria bacterium]|nr:cobalamin-binding protein [Acidobacteriota bacterium]MCA1639549.1 cobalamin-binding protein [Acidobacteriota bacterium]
MSNVNLKISEKAIFANAFLCELRAFTPNARFQKLAFISLLLCAFLFTNCKSEIRKAQVNSPSHEVTDDLGRRVKIPEAIERAVSLAPNLTEIVFAIGAGNKLVGVTSYCNYPIEAQKIQKVGDTLNPNIENIIALKPQIVLVSTASQIETFTKTLEQQDITVFVTNPNSLEDIYKSIYQTGEIFGKKEKSQEVVDDLKKRVADIEARTNTAKDIKVFLQISNEPLFTIGKESFLTDLIARAGGVSITETVATAYPKISKETAFALQPEAIILSDSEDNREPNEIFKNSPAVKNGNVFKINADLLSRPSPRIVDALEQIARDLHPKTFD